MLLRRLAIAIPAGLIIAILIILLIARFYKVDLTDVIKIINVESLTVFTILLFAAEALRAYRLKLLVSRYNKCSLLSSIVGRWAGSLFSIATPTIGGGEALRGVIASCSISAQAIGSGIVDGVLDFIVNYLLAVILLPISTLLYPNMVHGIFIAMLVGLPVFLFWFFIICGNKYGSMIVELPFTRRVKASKLRQLVTSIKIDKLLFVKALILTVMAWSLDVLNLAYFALQTSSTSLINAYIALVYSLLLGVIPTPGGAGPVDSLLATLIDPVTAITWRLLRILIIAAGGSIAFALALASCGPTLISYLSKRHNNR